MKAYFSAIIIYLLIGNFAFSNPVASDRSHPFYISSGQIKVSLDENFAEVVGTFRFKSLSGGDEYLDKLTIEIDIPIWLPAKVSTNPKEMLPFWKAYQVGQSYFPEQLSDSAFHQPLKFSLSVSGKTYLIREIALYDSKDEVDPLAKEPGFVCLMVSVSLPSTIADDKSEIVIKYRQPLRKTDVGSEFYYQPVFTKLPKGKTTTDRNQYAMTLQPKKDISLKFTEGVVRPPKTAQLPLNHKQPIRVKSKGQ